MGEFDEFKAIELGKQTKAMEKRNKIFERIAIAMEGIQKYLDNEGLQHTIQIQVKPTK